MNTCMVPVRKGSERLLKKNYLKIGDSSVLELALTKAIHAKVFDKIVLNTDDPNLEELALKLGIDL